MNLDEEELDLSVDVCSYSSIVFQEHLGDSSCSLEEACDGRRRSTAARRAILAEAGIPSEYNPGKLDNCISKYSS